jgi:hypothetical protein
VCFEYLHWALISLLAFGSGCGPNVRFAILTAADNMAAGISKCSAYLGRRILVAAEFHLQGLVFEVVDPETGIITRNQQFHLPVHSTRRPITSLDTSDLTALGILPPRTFDMQPTLQL